MPKQPHGAVASPQGERGGLVIGLVILHGRDLQDRVVARRRGVRVARHRKLRPEAQIPLGRDLLGEPFKPRADRIRDPPGRDVAPGALAH